MLWALEDRVVLGGGDALRAIAELVKRPLERVAWIVEDRVIWPLEERTGELSPPLRAASAAALVALAVAAGVLGLLWAANGGGSPEAKLAASPAPALPTPAPEETVSTARPVLHGAAPDFSPEGEGGASKVGGGEALTAKTSKADSGTAASASSASASAASAATTGEPAGPAALAVAHRFAAAFVRYETGDDSARIKALFHETAAPRLAGSLLRRPPRLPANAKVPRAKVVNLVPAPSHGGVYPVSVSLLRVGLTSELRLDMEKDEKSGDWQVTDVLG